MKYRNLSILSIIITYLVPGIFYGNLQIWSNITTQNNLSLPHNTFEEWRDAILDHNNMETEDLPNIAQNSISSLYAQAIIYQDWSNGLYSTEEKNQLLLSKISTPYIKYLGPDNLPIEGYDLKRNDDEIFELNFRVDDNIINEWIVRVYAYLDYDTFDTIISESEKFEDGSNNKNYQPGEEPLFEELNPDVSFMGIEFDNSLEDYEQWTSSEKDYTAKKNILGRIDQEIYFHIKVLYKKDVYEEDGWHSHYFYKNFYISGYWTSNLEYRKLNIKDDDISAPIISDINIINSPVYDGYENINFEIIAEDDSGISELYIDFLENEYFLDENNQIIIPNPRTPGEYEFSAIAIDADTDYQGDQLNTTINSHFEVLDDDLTPPQIFVGENECNWSISIIDGDGVIDSIASGNYSLLNPDGNILTTGDLSQEGSIYYISKEQTIPLKPGTYTLKIHATNNDIEWHGDEEISTAIEEIYINLEDCYNCVILQIEELKKYIVDNIDIILACIANYFLGLAQEDIEVAYELLLEDQSCWLSHLQSAKEQICLIEALIESLMNNKCISHDIGQYIIQSLHDIRNNIDLLIEYSYDYQST